MRELKEILKKNNIKASSYMKKGRSTIISTLDKKYVIKPKNNRNDIFEYLDNRNFNYYPKITDKDDDYEVMEYIDDNTALIIEKMPYPHPFIHQQQLCLWKLPNHI